MGSIVFPPCQREGCTETCNHWHDVDGSIRTHLESTCADPWYPTNRIGCVDTHEPADRALTELRLLSAPYLATINPKIKK